MEKEILFDEIKAAFTDTSSGCSAFSWETLDGKHLWGRNFDFNKIAGVSKITFLPRGIEFYTCGSKAEKNLVESSRQTAKYAAVGMGFMELESTPVLYEGMNEKGLMGGQLYYREFASFSDKIRPGTIPLQPPFAVAYFLMQCATVEEVVSEIERHLTFVNLPTLGTVPTIHWTFSDRTGETIIIEPDNAGVHIYRKTMGVLTNSPGYEWHRLNLLNYVHIRELDYDKININGDILNQCFSGSGALGIPGDWSSPSRFIRLSFLKKYGTKGENEADGVSKMFHLFNSVAFPMGMVRVSEQGVTTEYDEEISPYDYTIYTVVMCAESMKFYWTSYKNSRVQYVDLGILSGKREVVQFEIDFEEDFKNRME